MTRKTVYVHEIKERVNNSLLNTDDNFVEFRLGQIVLLEHILHSSGNYSGYNYLDRETMLNSTGGTTVGVKEWNEDLKRWDFDGTDDTRRYYY